MPNRVSLENIVRAREVIDPVFLNSPQFVSDSLSALLGCRLVVKVETTNPIRSFKGRGACFYMSGVPSGCTVVCASAGNFGQGMAYAARSREIKVIVFASVNASPLKVEKMKSFGAEVRLVGDDFDAAKVAARHFASESGHLLVEDSLDVATAEGAGTIGQELLQWAEPFDSILLALGNGALLTGVGKWVKAYQPHTSVLGIGAVGAPAMLDSWIQKKTVSYPRFNTIADGIGAREPIPEVLRDMEETCDEVLQVTDEQMIVAMRLIHHHLGLVAEPSAAAGIAAILNRREKFQGKLVATVICGGNLTPDQASKWLS